LCFGLVELVEQASDKETTDSGSILRIKDVVKDFGGVRAVDHCSFNVGSGTITGLIGPNGAGKTTIFNLITGFLKPSSGSVWFLDRRINGLPPYRIFQQGILRTFQIPRELKGMTVLENLMLVPGGQLGEKVWASWLMLWHRH
jgi:ABC-type branched-subunit amino acid transport system ATPase component